MRWIHCQLRAGKRLTMKQMMDEFERSERTINRDIERMKEEWDAPIAFQRPENYYSYTNATFDLPTVQLRKGELMAIFFFDHLLSQTAATPFEHDLRRVLQKIVEELPEEVSVRFDSLPEAFSDQVGPVR